MSYPVLLVLLIPQVMALSQAASGRTLFGMAKHRSLAAVTLIEGIANVVLSIILVRRFGVFGDAVGTAIPLSLTTMWFMPRHICRILNLRVRTYFMQVFLLPLVLVLPLIAALLLMRHWFVPHNYLQLVIHLVIGSGIYILGLAWATWRRKTWALEGIHDGDPTPINATATQG